MLTGEPEPWPQPSPKRPRPNTIEVTARLMVVERERDDAMREHSILWLSEMASNQTLREVAHMLYPTHAARLYPEGTTDGT